MAQKKVGALVKEARTQKGLTQEQLAKKVTGASAADISKLERGEVDFSQAQLKEIAKATDVTQSSLINAPKNVSASAAKKSASSTAKKSTSSTSKKTASSSSSTASKKTASSASKTSASKTSAKSSSTSTKTSTAKKASSTTSAAKKTTSAGTSMKVSATEKKLVELYRTADSNTKKVVMSILKGEMPEPPEGVPFPPVGTAGTSVTSGIPAGEDLISMLINNALQVLGKR